jgi:hypothetical protein
VSTPRKASRTCVQVSELTSVARVGVNMDVSIIL